MPSKEIEEFAKVLIREVRDEAVSACDITLNPNAQSIIAKRWREFKDNPAILKDVIIPDVVDAVLFALVQALDDGALHMKFVSKKGKEVDLSEEGEGELGGWYMGEWREAGHQRFVDYFSDDGE